MPASYTECHLEAEQELLEAASFYADQELGLEMRFFDEVDEGLEAISERPRFWPVITGAVRKKVLSRFPYNILYIVGFTYSPS